jgi:dUTP pyrophosphatase
MVFVSNRYGPSVVIAFRGVEKDIATKQAEELQKASGVPYSFEVTEQGYNVLISGINAIDLLSKIYDNLTTSDDIWNLSDYSMYLEMLGYSGSIPRCKFTSTKNAIVPSKIRASDEGYDLWLISIDKKISDYITRFETGIRVQPEVGYHVEILPRSSLPQNGYMLGNSIGLIDPGYTGTLKVTLVKIDPRAPDLTLPFKAVQMVLRKSNHFLLKHVDSLDNTNRGEGGFGSTG